MSKGRIISASILTACLVALACAGVTRCSLENASEISESEMPVGDTQVAPEDDDAGGGAALLEDAEEEQASNEQAQEIGGAQAAEEEVIEEPPRAGHLKDFSGLFGTTWQGANDAGNTLNLVNGAFVESYGDSVTVTYFDIDSEQDTQECLIATLLATRSLSEAAKPMGVIVRSDGANQTLESDGLSDSYVRIEVEGHEVTIANDITELVQDMGIESMEIARVLTDRANAVSPQATEAVWTGEAYKDYGSGLIVTAFELNDGAATRIQVTCNKDKVIEAL